MLCVLALVFYVDSHACTSVIISSKATASGKPLMLKNRDTDSLDNSIEYFKGPLYSFVGLVNSNDKIRQVWTGTNSSGFSIMNTASYNLKYDDVKDSEMNKEGELMFRALGMCATLNDFENFLDNIVSKPYGVQSNFGVIDASGGAAYYEVDNYSWKKYDVNEIPCGYRVVTNFSESGKKEDYKGYERYVTASSIMNDFYSNSFDGKMEIGPHDLLYGISRSYKNSFIGLDYLSDFNSLKSDYGFTGIVPDQDFIPRRSTSSAIVIEGVRPGEDPLHTVMWTVLGYPCCSVSVPVLVCDEDIVPYYLKTSYSTQSSEMCDFALNLKNTHVFKFNVSNGSQYIDLNSVLDFLHSCLMTESYLEEKWIPVYEGWTGGKLDLISFKKEYKQLISSYFVEYLSHFMSFSK